MKSQQRHRLFSLKLQVPPRSRGDFPSGSAVKNPLGEQEKQMWVQFLSQEDPLEDGMATHSSILAWRIPWTESGGLYSTASQRDMTEVTEHECT